MEYDKIEIDFIDRTLKLIEEYNGEYDVTLLINCCLGLLVLPKEKHFKSIPDKNIPDTGPLWGLSRKSVSVNCRHCDYALSNVIRKIRNGICHFNIKTLPDGSGKIKKIEIKDRGNFKVVLLIKEFEELAKSFAGHVKETLAR